MEEELRPSRRIRLLPRRRVKFQVRICDDVAEVEPETRESGVERVSQRTHETGVNLRMRMRGYFFFDDVVQIVAPFDVFVVLE